MNSLSGQRKSEEKERAKKTKGENEQRDGERSLVAPMLWNSLPDYIRGRDHYPVLKPTLRHIFSNRYMLTSFFLYFLFI